MPQTFRPEFFVTLAITAAVAFSACTPETANPVAPAERTAAPTPATAPPEDRNAAARPIVVILGDSLTAGYQLPPQAALPEQLQIQLDDNAVTATIVNAGVSGDTTRGGLERYEWSVKGANADILLIALGGNDFLSGMGVEAPKANLAAIIERAQADNIMVGLIGVSIPKRDGLDTRDQQFDAIYPSLASKYDIPLYPNMMALVFGRPDVLMPDGIHPTAEGVELMAYDLSGFVTELVEVWRAHND